MEMEMKIKVRSEEYEKMTDLSVAMRLDWRVEVETAYFECVPDISFTLCSLSLSSSLQSPISKESKGKSQLCLYAGCTSHDATDATNTTMGYWLLVNSLIETTRCTDATRRE